MPPGVGKALRAWRPLLVGVPTLGALAWAMPHLLDNYYLSIVLLAGINVILAVSLNIVNGLTGQFSIGHAGFMAVGGYAAAKITLAAAGPGVADDPYRIGFVLALVAGGFVAAGAGWLVGVPSLRLRGDYLAIVTLGFGEIIRVLIENTQALGGATGLSGIPELAGFFWVYLWVLLSVAASMRLRESTHGRALLSIREDEIAAEAMGVDTVGYKVKAFVISAFFAGVAGGLFAHSQNVLNPKTFTFIKSIEVVAMVVLGGMGSITGAVVAAVLLTVLPEGLRNIQDLARANDLPAWMSLDYRMVIYSLTLVVLMLVRPRGLFGTWELWHLWRKPIPPAPSEVGEAAAGESLLWCKNVTVRFGGLTAVSDFNLTLRPRELVALIGPNGAGKTTAFNAVTGVFPPTEGGVLVGGRDVRGLEPHAIASLGVARTFQNIRLFKDLTVFDNVRIACHHLTRASASAAVRHGSRSLAEEDWIAARADEFLTVMGLSHRREELARNLPYGEQRRLEIARALATGPKVLLLDEPAAGMNPRESLELMDTIRHIRDRFDLAILLIEHDMKVVMGVSERILVLDHGVTIAEGAPREIQKNPKVIEAYLGEKYAKEHAPAEGATP